MTRLILLSICISISVFLSAQDEFTTTWKIEANGELLTIPIQSGYNYEFQIDWGDGSPIEEYTDTPKHTYVQAGIYDVKITGKFPSIYLNNDAEALKLIEIKQWGSIKWESMRNAFYGAKNMVITGTARFSSGAPNLSATTDMTNTFRGCSSMISGLNFWDVSTIELMEGTFQDASAFGGILSSWNVSSVTSMRDMFHGASHFSGGLEGLSWDVASVTNMSGMFAGATSFTNGSTGSWDVSTVTTMANMFAGATNFNGFISEWNVKNVASMIGMFGEAESFNQNLNDWDVSSVTNMFAMFKGAKKFNKSLKDWDVSHVTNMSFMFCDAEAYNQDISKWEITNVSLMVDFLKDSGMSPNFYDKALMSWLSQTVVSGVTLGVGNITFCAAAAERALLVGSYNWNITDGGKSCYDPSALVLIFETTLPNQTVYVRSNAFNNNYYSVDWESDGIIDSIDVSYISGHAYPTPGRYAVSITGDFRAPYMRDYALREIAQWGDVIFTNLGASFRNNDLLQVTATDAPTLSDIGFGGVSMGGMFSNCYILNADINHWDVSNVTDMSDMFYNISDFNQDLNDWNVENVTDMNRMFSFARAFNGDISSWDVGKVTDMSKMFSVAQSFNQDIGSWNVESVTDMSEMFTETYDFNQDIGDWEVGAVTNMSNMFRTNLAFNQDISQWDVSQVTDMSAMFWDCDSFNKSISNWNVRKVESFESMFFRAIAFNQHFNGWLTLAARDMSSMFNGATSFNQRIDGLFTVNVTDMRSMFEGATAYNQPMISLHVGNVDSMSRMFYNATSLDQNLENWDITNVTDMTDMLSNSGMSRENYDNTLIGWANNGQSLQNNVPLGAEGLTFCDGTTSRNALLLLGWTITGDMLDCSNSGPCTEARPNNYIGPDGGDWHDSNNWARGFIPDACDEVSIGLDKSVSLSADAQCFTIDIFPGSSLTVDGHELTVSALISN